MTKSANQIMGQVRVLAGSALMLAVVAATFAPFGNQAFAAPGDPHTITVSAGANGSISPTGPVATTEGSVETFTITADGGFMISDVSVDGTPTGDLDGSYDLTVTADHTISATFSPVGPPPGDTTPPNAPTLISPTDGQVMTSAALTLLDWSDETDPSSPVTYIYQSSNVSGDVDGNGDFVNILYTSGNLSDSEIPTGGNPEGTYYWHVKAVDDEGNESDWSSTFTFTLDNSATWYVDASFAGSEDGSQASPFNTIEEAIDAAIDGDTIMVAGGTYAEQLSVSKELTFKGAQAGVDARGRAATETVVDGSTTGTPFAIMADNVTIDGFTITNGQNGGYYSGIWMQDPENATIENNIFTNNTFGIWADCGGDCVIENNWFTSDASGPSGSAGISADSTVDLVINENEFEGLDDGNPILLQAVAAGAHTNIEVTDNSFHGNAFSNAYVLGVSGGVFSGNEITPAGDATGFSFSGGNDDIEVTGNTITGGARGIRIEDAGYSLGGNTNVILRSNDLSGNTEYGLGFTELSGTVDAILNWWGSYTGPTVASNPNGVGATLTESVTDSVSYSMWCTNVDCEPDTEEPEVTLNGASTIEVFVDDVFVDPGATATDNDDTSVTVVTTGTVNTSVPGTYTLTYTATDVSGNVGTAERSVEVNARGGNGGGGGSSNGGGNSGNNGNGNGNGGGEVGGGQVLGAAIYNFIKDLTIGSTGVDVTELQKILIALGYLKIDVPTGYFGPLTHAAVKLFQGAHGVPQTGYVGPLTRAALNAQTAVTTPDAAKLAALEAQLKVLLELLEKSRGN